MKMRMSLMLVPAALAGLALSGCAATQPVEPAAKKYEVDQQYIAAVERSAKRLPLTIIWVNPPEKKVEKQ
jgi:outer membrane murein-binding lipoprotein Lpp